MCKSCFVNCAVSAIATWGFFAMLLKLLNVGDFYLNAVWLTLLVSAAMFFCPVMNHKLADCCEVKPKKKK